MAWKDSKLKLLDVGLDSSTSTRDLVLDLWLNGKGLDICMTFKTVASLCLFYMHCLEIFMIFCMLFLISLYLNHSFTILNLVHQS